MKSRKPVSFPPEAVLTNKQVAEYLQISARSVQRLPLKTITLGYRTVRYRGQDVLDYVERKAR